LAVHIRLRRTGKKKQPHYRLVVADTRSPRDGRFLEVVGHYDPRPSRPEVRINGERALFWLKKGAQPTATVKSLLKKEGVWERFAPGESAPPPQPESPAPDQAAEPTETEE
jgi:small subunit ribosomal protein S16